MQKLSIPALTERQANLMLLITQGSDEVVLWEQVEDWHTGTVIESIEDLAKNIQELLDAKERHW